MRFSPTIELAQNLIQKPSITPKDEGCQIIIGQHLSKIGFELEQMDAEDVSNLWAKRGHGKPLVVFAGHTDVVPTGPPAQWNSPPFNGAIIDGMLHGRGAADMKGSIAAFITACERFIQDNPHHRGSIGLLITSDEEGPAKFGTGVVVDELARRGEKIDMCIVGEPTSVDKLGDTIKVGRRGSLNATLTVIGIQGHIAYPLQADNPIHRILPALNEIISIKWDQGNENFQPTSLQISNFRAGTGATNVIPGEAEVLFNLRFSPEITPQRIKQGVEKILSNHGIDYRIQWDSSGLPFETKPGELVDTIVQSINEITGRTPILSTSGGTSDGRFIAPTGAQVVELGPVNATIHQINEQIAVADLDQLSACYQRILEKLLPERMS